jgi:hypothetical protein
MEWWYRRLAREPGGGPTHPYHPSLREAPAALYYSQVWCHDAKTSEPHEQHRHDRGCTSLLGTSSLLAVVTAERWPSEPLYSISNRGMIVSITTMRCLTTTRAPSVITFYLPWAITRVVWWWNSKDRQVNRSTFDEWQQIIRQSNRHTQIWYTIVDWDSTNTKTWRLWKGFHSSMVLILPEAGLGHERLLLGEQHGDPGSST